jgi:hypothetical protein
MMIAYGQIDYAYDSQIDYNDDNKSQIDDDNNQIGYSDSRIDNNAGESGSDHDGQIDDEQINRTIDYDSLIDYTDTESDCP